MEDLAALLMLLTFVVPTSLCVAIQALDCSPAPWGAA